MKKILVIDGNSIINRAFYGVHFLQTRDGRPTNAIFGMLNIIERQMEDLHPDYAAVAFDLKAPTFRHVMYRDYKAGRHETPPELLAQFDDAKELLRLMGFHVLELEGYEADDIQGTVSKMVEKLDDGHAYILSGDRDLFQLIDDRTTVLYASSETLPFDRAAFMAKYPGVTPEQFVDVKALMGDASDHIPGVPGIGEKTALKLISEFGSLDELYLHLDAPSITKGVRAKLEAGKESAELSRTLARILRDVPLGVTLEDLVYAGLQKEALKAKLLDLELNSFIQRFHLQGIKTQEEQEVEPLAPIEPLLKEDFSKLGNRFALHVTDTQNYLSCEGHNYVYEGGLSDLQELFENPENQIVVFEGKALYHTLKDLGISIDARLDDLSLYLYVLDSSKGMLSLSSMCTTWLHKTFANYTEVAALMWNLSKVLFAEIQKEGCESLLLDVELPLLKVLAEMEENGFLMDRDGLTHFGDELTSYIERITKEIYAAAGRAFNINSPKQLGEVLFEELALPYPKGKSKSNGTYSTDAETLEELRSYGIVENILLYRQLSKLYSTYVVGLLSSIEEDGRVHTDFKQSLTATGRLSSAEPNLQNIPIRTPLGKEMRRFFIPSEGCILVDADYSQIELRLAAILSGDKELIRAFNDGTDIHTMTASNVFGCTLDEVTPAMRKRAKAINFGILYGIGPYSLAQSLKISFGEAKEYIAQFKRSFPAIQEYLDTTIKGAQELGYTATYYGRKRYFPELQSSRKEAAIRQAMNAPIQGTAADIMKKAMISVYETLKEQVPSAKLLMQVHDELVVECKVEDEEQVKSILQNCMEHVAQFPVPLTAEASSGKTWLL